MAKNLISRDQVLEKNGSTILIVRKGKDVVMISDGLAMGHGGEYVKWLKEQKLNVTYGYFGT